MSLPLSKLLYRPTAVDVHVEGLDRGSIPAAVISFLSKGEKLAPSRGLCRLQTFYDCTHEFRLQLRRSVVLAENQTGSRDPLSGLRRRWFRCNSRWQSKTAVVPPECDRFADAVIGMLLRSSKLRKSLKQSGGLGATWTSLTRGP